MFGSLSVSISIGITLLYGPKMAAQSDNFPDVPDNHWAYERAFPVIPANHWAFEIMFEAKNLGMLPEDKRSLFYSGRPYGRYEIAAFADDITKHLDYEARTQNFDAKIKARGEKDALKIEKSLAFICDAMPKFDLAFGSELRSFGVNPDTLAKKAKSLERKFNRVVRAYERKSRLS